MSPFAAWALHIAYAAALYTLGRQRETARVADVLFAGWAASLLFDAAGGGPLSLLFRAMIDVTMAMILLTQVPGRGARWAGLAFIPILFADGLGWAEALEPDQERWLLAVCAFGQIAAIIGGVWGDGLARWLGAQLDRGADLLGRRSADRARISGLARPEKEGAER